MKFSIIMPVYNTGELLHTTIKSVLRQSFKDFELLLVDDGSTDDSPSICDYYAKSDSRVRCFHKRNGGICEARNFGLKHAQGDFIGFCDHDDEYLQDYLQDVDKAIDDYAADMVKVGFVVVRDGDTINATQNHPCTTVECHHKESIRANILRLIANDTITTVWNCFWKRKVIAGHQIEFDPSFIHGGEDIDFNYHTLPHIKCLALLPQCRYVHYVRASLSTSAKAYPDVWHSFYRQVVGTNRLMTALGIDFSSIGTKDHEYYNLCFMQRLVSFFSYAIKLNKRYNETEVFLKDFTDAYLLKDQNGNMPKAIKMPSDGLSTGKKYAFQIIYCLFTHRHYRLIHTLFYCKMQKLPSRLRSALSPRQKRQSQRAPA